MQRLVVSLFLALAIAAVPGCAPRQEGRVMARSGGFWSENLGKTVTVEGTAADAKLGALLLLDGGRSIWIDGLDAWPKGFYRGGDDGKRVRVTGTVVRRDDLPVFVQRPGEPVMAGIPVASEAEREKAKWRFLLAGARWTALD